MAGMINALAMRQAVMANTPHTATASGSMASFSTDMVGKLRHLVVGIEPVQDLHGYDNPWPAGGGKNKFDIDKMVITSSISISNGIITVTGNAQNSTKKLSELADLAVGETYVLTANTTGSDKYIYLYGTGANVSWNFGASKTITQEMLDALVMFYGGQNTTSQISNFMIRPDSVSDASYAPYSNICPITGRDAVEVQTTDVNILPFPYVETSLSRFGITYTVNDDGTITANGTASADSWFVLSNAWPYTADRITGQPIRLSGCPAGGSTSTFFISSVVTGHNDVGSGVSINNFRAGYFRFQISIKSGTTVNNLVFKPMVVIGTSVEDYHPYSGNRYTISWESIAGTVYGGTLDVVTGVLTVDRAMVDLGTLEWTTVSNNRFKAEISNLPILPDNNTYPPAICSMYKGATPNNYINSDDIFHFSSSIHAVYIRDTSYIDASAFTTGVSGAQLVYRIATPQIYQLSSTMVKSLIGTNNVWADTGDVESLTYWTH